jgi:hypothetical protein
MTNFTGYCPCCGLKFSVSWSPRDKVWLAASAVGGAAGAHLGRSVGLAALGTAFPATWLFAAVGVVLSGMAAKNAVNRMTGISCPSPECGHSFRPFH